MVGLTEAGGGAPGHVHHGGAGHHQAEGGDHRQQTPGPGRLPGRHQQPDRERHVEGAELAGHVHGGAGVLAEQQRGGGQHQLGERHHEQRPSGRADHLAQRRQRRGRGRLGAEDGGGEVGDGLGLAHPHHPVQRGELLGPGGAGLAGVEVGVDGRRRRGPADSPSSRAEIASRIGVASHGRGGRPTGRVGSRRSHCRGGREAVDELTQLALAAGTGDRVATTAFVRRTQPEVWRVCARLGDRDDADDLTQEVYLRALPCPGGVPRRVVGADLAPADHALRLRRPRARPHPPPVVARSARAARGRLRRASRAERTGELDLDDLIGRLDPDRREAFVLTQVAGLSYAEAAMVCEVPIGTIRSRVARARADLLDGLIDERGADSGS